MATVRAVQGGPEARGVSRALSFLLRHPYAVLAALAFAGMAPPFILKGHTEWDEVYLKAAGDMAAGRSIYAARIGYVYPPLAAFAAMPFTLLPPMAARVAWYGVNVACMVAMFGWAWRLSGGGREPGATRADLPEHFVMGLGLLCGATFAFNALSHHQSDLVIGALLMGGCVALTRSRDLTAGVCFGLAAALKGPALLWCPYLLWRRRWGAAFAVAATALGACLLPNVFFTPPGGGLWLGDWVRDALGPLRDAGYQPGLWYADMNVNQSLAGAVGRWFTTTWTWGADGAAVVPRPGVSPEGWWAPKAVVAFGAAALLLGTALAQGWRRSPAARGERGDPPPAALEFSMILMLMLLLSPMSSKAHFGIMVLPGFCLARALVARRSAGLAVLLGLALLTQLFAMRLMWDWAWVGLWYGSLSATTLLHLIGAGYLLRTGPARPAS